MRQQRGREVNLLDDTCVQDTQMWRADIWAAEGVFEGWEGVKNDDPV